MKPVQGLLGVLFVMLPYISVSQRLELFTSHSGQMLYQGSMEKVPYSQTSGFYDFIPEGHIPDTVIDKQACYFVYFKIPYEITEIGVRMISPVPSYSFAEAGDVVTASYESNKRATNYFNPWIAVEHGVSNIPGSSINEFETWEVLGKNDDSQELPAQPSGKQTNSLLRIYQGPYAPGIYRILFRSGGKGDPAGSYLLQLGTVPGVKRLKLSRTIRGLTEE